MYELPHEISNEYLYLINFKKILEKIGIDGKSASQKPIFDNLLKSIQLTNKESN